MKVDSGRLFFSCSKGLNEDLWAEAETLEEYEAEGRQSDELTFPPSLGSGLVSVVPVPPHAPHFCTFPQNGLAVLSCPAPPVLWQSFLTNHHPQKGCLHTNTYDGHYLRYICISTAVKA